jgi:hypothetical protein
LVHVGFRLGVRNRIATMIDWFCAYFRFAGGIHLITGMPRVGASAPIDRASQVACSRSVELRWP